MPATASIAAGQHRKSVWHRQSVCICSSGCSRSKMCSLTQCCRVSRTWLSTNAHATTCRCSLVVFHAYVQAHAHARVNVNRVQYAGTHVCTDAPAGRVSVNHWLLLRQCCLLHCSDDSSADHLQHSRRQHGPTVAFRVTRFI
jgi:hypothetical protein